MADRRIAALAEAVADGSPIDWVAAESAAATESERGIIRRLKRIGQLADRQRRLPAVAQAPATTEHPAAAPAETGSAASWGHLILLEQIGEGAFGEVYRAHDPKLARDVALKLLREPTSQDGRRASAVIDEGRLLARIRHPNVVTVHGADRIDDRVGVWMDFIRGRTLEQVLREHGPLGPRETALIGLDLSRALAAVHQAGLVHRDVKAQNVMREDGGRLVLMDFGAGRDGDGLGLHHAADLTGTPLYLAPEVFEGEPASSRSDVYSLGVLLYHLVTGSYPIAARTLSEVMKAHELHTRAHLRDVRPDLPLQFVRVVERALAADPDARFASAGAMEAALADTLSSELASPADLAPTALGVPRFAWRRRAVGVGAAILVVLLSTAATLWSLRQPAISFQARDWVLISNFDNRTGEPVLDGSLEFAIERELGNSQFVNVVPNDRIEQTLRLMRKPPDSRIDPALGREICVRDGAIRALVTGRVEKLGSTYVLSANVVDPIRDRTVARLTEEGPSGTGLATAIGRLSGRVRQTLGEDLSAIQQSDQELAKVTTPSFQALQLYSRAKRALSHNMWDPNKIAELLRQAVIEDPDFASAHTALAIALQEDGKSLSEYLPVARRGFDLSANASERERYFIQAKYFEWSDQDDKALASYMALMDLYPDDGQGLSDLAELYERLGRGKEAIPLWIHYVKLRPNDLAANARAAYLLLTVLGSHREAQTYLDRAARLPTSEHDVASSNAALWIELLPVRTAWLNDHPSAALAGLHRFEQATQSRDNPMFSFQLGWAYATLGQFKAASAHFLNVPHPRWRNHALAQLAFLRDDSVALRERLEPFRGIQVQSPLITSLMTRAGLLSEAQTRAQNLADGGYGFTASTLGGLALARGDTDTGIALIEEEMARPRVGTHPAVFIAAESLADFYERHGNVRSAIRLLEGMSVDRAKVGAPEGGMGFPYWLRTQAQLARVYRQAGSIQSARILEDQLRTLLMHADDDHPIVRQLGRLKDSRAITR